MDLTPNQVALMRNISPVFAAAKTATELAQELGYPWSRDQVDSSLRRLEKRGIVSRVGKPARWFRTLKAHTAFVEQFGER